MSEFVLKFVPKKFVEVTVVVVTPLLFTNNCSVWIPVVGADEYNAIEPLILTGFIVSCVATWSKVV